jgi:hypothetical protein
MTVQYPRISNGPEYGTTYIDLFSMVYQVFKTLAMGIRISFKRLPEAKECRDK